MSEIVGQVVDPDVQPPPQPMEQEQPQVQAQTEQPQTEPQEDDIPEAVEVQPGVRVVPVGVVQALRNELKALKPLAQRTQQLEQQVNEARPYVDFLRQNPQLLQPRQPQPAPQPQPQDDPALVQIARTLDLYTADGKPDVARAQTVREMTRAEAAAAAQQAIAPVQHQTFEQQAGQNVQRILNTAKVAGKPIEQQYVTEAIRTITQSVPKHEAMRILADPTVASVIELTATGLQARAMGAPPPAPTVPALHVESAGGGSQFELPESSKLMARKAGIKEADFAARAAKYQPGRANPLE